MLLESRHLASLIPRRQGRKSGRSLQVRIIDEGPAKADLHLGNQSVHPQSQLVDWLFISRYRKI